MVKQQVLLISEFLLTTTRKSHESQATLTPNVVIQDPQLLDLSGRRLSRSDVVLCYERAMADPSYEFVYSEHFVSRLDDGKMTILYSYEWGQLTALVYNWSCPHCWRDYYRSAVQEVR